MRILFLAHSFNSLAQRLHVELRALGHDVTVEFDINDAVAEEAIALFDPDIVLAPFLKRAIPESIFGKRLCLVVHPGPPGDGGPAALDHAILDGVPTWGVTVLQASGDLDGGPVWASRTFAMRVAAKSSLYRHEATEAAVSAVREAIARHESGEGPQPIQPARAERIWRGPVKAAERAIDWKADDTATVLRKIASGDGMPGASATLDGRVVRLFDARPADLNSEPGTLVARSGPALGIATRDGGVWIGRLIDSTSERPFKLPATRVLSEAALRLPEISAERGGYSEISWREAGGVGTLAFPFYNGAMGTQACRRLLAAFNEALARPVRVIVLDGGPDHWSNGLDLNEIEAADSPADASLANIEAMDDLAEAIIRATDRLIVAAVGGNAGAGGAFLARAADLVWIRHSAVLNPHYKDMGNLYGSEFWTYLLPKHAGAENAARIAAQRLPMGAEEAKALGLADAVIDGSTPEFSWEVARRAAALAGDADLDQMIAAKDRQRADDEAQKPLAAYRAEELAHMRRNFYGFDPSYHVARYNFVRKIPKSRTPSSIAVHRRSSANVTGRMTS